MDSVMRSILFTAALALPLLAACGSPAAPAAAASDASTGADAGAVTADSGFSDGGSPGDAGASADGGAGCTPGCTGAHLVCDPLDERCKLDGTTTHVGDGCDTSGRTDPRCGSDPAQTCNDLPNDGFPAGYCTFEPAGFCGVAPLKACPLGSSCAALGAESPGCYKNCVRDSDCRTADGYKCQEVDRLYRDGASHKVCYKSDFECAAAADCPSRLPNCLGATARALGTCGT